MAGTTLLRTRATRDASRRFYVWMSGICLAIAILGFVPTYFAPILQGTFAAEPVVHIHGMILFAWVSLLFAQSLLVARGHIIAHRTWGMLGVSIATAIVFITLAVVSLRIAQASGPGQPQAVAHAVRAFEWPIVSELLFFTSVFILAIVWLRRPETHKRLLLLATISFLGAPIGRWFRVFLAPASPPGASDVAVPPVSVLVGPSLVGNLLIVVAIVHDWRTRGRPHPVYLIGGAALLLLELTAVPVSETRVWQAVATAIGHLAG